MSDANLGLKSALLDYVKLQHAPNYAVLVTGPWGIGKTFVVRNCLDDAQLEHGYFYVSLFGAQSKEDVEAAIFKAVYPVLSGKVTKVGTAVSKAVLNIVGVDTDLKLEDMLAKVKSGIYVFDDLERAELKLGSILGYLNEFVEHDGCRVILIANTQHNLEEDETFKTQKEKLVGRTLRVRSSVQDALGFFLSKIDNAGAKQHLSESRDTIIQIFEESGAENLRVLQQCLWDFERLYNVLSDDHVAVPDIVDRLLRLSLAFGIEIKTGQLDRAEIERRATQYADYFTSIPGQDSAMKTANDRYAGVDLFDSLLSNSIIVEAFMDGYIDHDSICKYVDDQPPFRNEVAPAWRVLWLGPFRCDQELDTALGTHILEFAKHEYTAPGIILHLLYVRKRLARLGLISASEKDVTSELKQYVDQLKDKGLLEAINPNDVSESLDQPIFDGLAYVDRESTDFQDLLLHLSKRCHEVFAEDLKSESQNLIHLLAENPAGFIGSVSPIPSENNHFISGPILSHVEPGDFVDKLLEASPPDQVQIVQALYSRYSHGGLRSDFAAELTFLTQLLELLREKREQAKGFEQERVDGMSRQLQSLLEK